MQGSDLIDAWRKTLIGPGKSWVLFENGTLIVLLQPAGDLVELARAVMREHGPVYPGSAAGDFQTVTLDNGLGWVVGFDHPDMLTFVGLDELEAGADDVNVGLLGRAKRSQDAEELSVLHVEDTRRLEGIDSAS